MRRRSLNYGKHLKMKKTKTWSESWIEIGYKQVAMCNENSPIYISSLVNCIGMRMVMVTVYNSLVLKKKIEKIEDLPLEEKNILWKQTKEFAKDSLSLIETIRLSKALYALEYLLT